MQIIPLNLDSVLLLPHNSKLAYWEMAQTASDLVENNHTGRKLSTMAIMLGFLIEIFFILLSS